MSWLFLLDGGGDAVSQARIEGIVLPHPRSNEPARFMLRDGDLLEVQKATPKLPSSWLSGERVVQDGGVHVATRIDPLFLVLPLLEKASQNYSPLDQILASPEMPHVVKLRHCRYLELAHLCDVSDAMGPDMPLYRMNEAKVITWLRRKVQRLTETLAADASAQHRIASNVDGFRTTQSGAAAAINTTTATHPTVTDEQRSAAALDAAQLVSDYLNPSSAFAWSTKLAGACSLKAEQLSPSAIARAAKRKKEKELERRWDDQSAATDSLRDITHGAPASKKQKTAEAAKKHQTVANKQLAKVNTKGMKSMMSFFGKKN